MRRSSVSFLAALTALSLGSPSRARAAEHDLGVGPSVGFVQLRDDALVPLRFAGLGLGLTGGYARRTTHVDFEVRTRLALAGVWERYGNGGVALLPWWDAALRIELPSDSKWRSKVGPWLGVHELDGYYESWDDEHSYWLAYSALGASGELTLPAGARVLATELAVPLVALVSRPPRYRLYKADPLTELGFHFNRAFDDPTLATVNRLLGFRLRGTYRGQGAGFRVDPWAELEFDTYSEPARVTELSLWLGAEARWGL